MASTKQKVDIFNTRKFKKLCHLKKEVLKKSFLKISAWKSKRAIQ